VNVLLAGVSVRALALSATRGGHEVACLDHFGDSDLPAGAPCRSILREFGDGYDARKLIKLAHDIEYDALAYVANLENHPELVRQLAGDRPVIGNNPDILKKARHWPIVRQVCAQEGIPMPPTLFPGEEHKATSGLPWLRKPVKSGGGHSIRPWDGEGLDNGHYLQAGLGGVPASAVFAADGTRCRVLGVSEQLISIPKLGARGFRYCGNVFPLAPVLGGGSILNTKISALAEKLTSRFGLRGVNGLDFLIETDERGEPSPILLEINPRPTASAELMEESLGINIFNAHLGAASGWLPDGPEGPPKGYMAKGIIFAQTDITVPDTSQWPAKNRRDVPHSGQRIAQGRPICTAFTSGPDRRTCLAELARAAHEVRLETGDKAEHS
jgi:hypothetical protein